MLTILQDAARTIYFIQYLILLQFILHMWSGVAVHLLQVQRELSV